MPRADVPPRQVWTSSMELYLAEIVQGRSLSETTDLMNQRFGLHLTQDQVRGRKSKLGLHSGYRPQATPRSVIPRRLELLEDDVDLLRGYCEALASWIRAAGGEVPDMEEYRLSRQEGR